MTDDMKLALHGGQPAVQTSLPKVEDASGRMIGEEELALVTEVVKSGRLNYMCGPMVHRFEDEFAHKFGTSHAVATSSGTASIHAAIIALDLEPYSEVIVAPITDKGTIIPILMQQLIPVFADVDPETSSVDPERVRSLITDRTGAILVVHMFGHPVNMDPIMKMAKERGIPVIEDCCQAFLTRSRGTLCGTIGDIGCFSFQQSKHMTTGDGGMVITNNPKLGERIRLSGDKGWPRQGQFRDHLFLAPAYHMTELQAAVGIGQLGKLETIVKLRREAAERMRPLLQDIAGLHAPVEKPWATHTYWKYPVLLDTEQFDADMDQIAEALNAEGVQSWAGYTKVPIYQYDVLTVPRTFGKSGLPMSAVPDRGYHYGPGLCPEAERIHRRMIVLPWSERYEPTHLEQVANGLRKVLGHYRRQ